jgi:hypothetical protein
VICPLCKIGVVYVHINEADGSVFMGCNRWEGNRCSWTRSLHSGQHLAIHLDMDEVAKCPRCEDGIVTVKRNGEDGSLFLGCSAFAHEIEVCLWKHDLRRSMPVVLDYERFESAEMGVNGKKRSGESWDEVEDQLLIKRYQEGMSIKDLASQHSRSVGAVRSRLKKLRSNL